MTQTLQDVLASLQSHLQVRAEMLAAMYVLDPIGTARLIERQRDQDWKAADEIVATMNGPQLDLWLGRGEDEGIADQFAAA